MTTPYNEAYFDRYFAALSQWEPEAARRLISLLGAKSLADFGCGAAFFVTEAVKLGLAACGLEGNLPNVARHILPEVLPFVQQRDVTVPIRLPQKYDCVVSMEVAEHIDPAGSEIFVSNLVDASSRLIVLTAAPPGQDGTGHINCREQEFWKMLFEDQSCVYDADSVQKVQSAWRSIKTKGYCAQHIARNLMIFRVT